MMLSELRGSSDWWNAASYLLLTAWESDLASPLVEQILGGMCEGEEWSAVISGSRPQTPEAGTPAPHD
jgi:hypothetical protein